MFISIALSDGSIAFVNLHHIVNIVRTSAEECIINLLAGNPIIVQGKDEVDRILKRISEDHPGSPAFRS